MLTVWKGSIAFGLVSIPVRLVSATEEKDISLRQVHEADGGRIKYKRVCSVDGEEVSYGNIAKGYELPDGEMVVLTDKDFADLPIASTKTVEVLSFADASEINPVALSRAYYADPSGDAKPYVLLHDTLVATNKVAIVKVALRQKERLATIRAQDGVLVVHTMLWPDEVRKAQFGFMNEEVNVRSQELDMATTYVEAFDQGFEPKEYHDQYREALLEVVDAKVAGHDLKRPPAAAAEATNVVDLMDALRASVAAADGSKRKSATSGGSSSTRKTAATKAAAKKATKKSSASKKSTTSKSTAKKAAKGSAKKAAKGSSSSRRTA